jgi:TPR repeat protein
LVLFVVLLGASIETATALECLDRYAADVQAAAQRMPKTPADLDRAIAALTAIAEDGYAPAMYVLAQDLAYRQGPGDAGIAEDWMRLAAARGYPPAYAPLGNEALARAERAEGRGELRRAHLLEREALFWYRLGEAHGEPDALWGLSEIYRRGKAVPDSAETAFNYERSAVEQGVTSVTVDPPLAERFAQLSLDYAQGNGAASDVVQAYRWRLAEGELADETHAATDMKRLQIELGLTDDQTEEATRLWHEWKRPDHDYAQRAPYAFEPVPVSDDIVRRVQGALIAAGLEPGPVSGRFSDATARAIIDYEALDGTPATGAVTHRLVEGLRIQPGRTRGGSCSSRWLDAQPADIAFPEPLDSPAADESGAGSGAGTDAEDVPAAGTVPAGAAEPPAAVLDRVMQNNEAMLRHQMVNDAQREFESSRDTSQGRVRAGGAALCADIGSYLESLRPGPDPAVREGCFAAPAGTPLRVMWCVDADASLCEFELQPGRAEDARRGWGEIGIVE